MDCSDQRDEYYEPPESIDDRGNSGKELDQFPIELCYSRRCVEAAEDRGEDTQRCRDQNSVGACDLLAKFLYRGRGVIEIFVVRGNVGKAVPDGELA